MICFGIDVSKGSSTVTGISSDGYIAFKTQSIEHTQEQVSALVKTIQFFSASNEIQPVSFSCSSRLITNTFISAISNTTCQSLNIPLLQRA